MGFRQPLDVGRIVEKYQEFLGHSSTASINYVHPGLHNERETEPEAIPKRLYAPEEDVERPLRVGAGPDQCSPSLRLQEARPLLAWDPNRYYRDLGISWPYVDATRGDLRRGFYAVHGHSSPWLTYCLSQLLNPQVRAEYDALPLGERYLDDKYVQEEMKAKAAAEASRRSERGKDTHAEDVLDEWGYVLRPEASDDLVAKEDDDTEDLDTDRSKRFDEDAHQGPGADWGYSYYLWRTHKRDSQMLSAWQSALISAPGAQEMLPAFAVGLLGREPNEYAIAQVNDTWVVFINHKAQVTSDLALAAATALHRQIREDSASNTAQRALEAGNPHGTT